MNFKSFAKTIIVIFVLLSVSVSLNGQTTQGRRPTTFPDLPQLTDSTLLFTQDSSTHQSYKFTLDRLKSFVGKSTCLDSSFANINDCIPVKQIKNGGSVYYHNTFGEIFGDTSGTIQLCDAVSEFPNLASQVIAVDGNKLDINTGISCSTGYIGGYSFSQDFPVDVRLCQQGYISEIRAKAIISNYNPNFDNNVPELTVLALSVNDENVETSNTIGGDTPGTISILGIPQNPDSYEFVYNNVTMSTVNTVRVTFFWIGGSSFSLDGLSVTYKIAGCPCYQQFLTTDSLGCMKLDSVILPDPFTLRATNGLSLQNESTVKLGGTLNQNTTLNGNGNQIQFNGFSNIQLNSYYHDDNNPNMNFSTNYYQSGTFTNQNVWRGDNNNAQDESSGYYINPNRISQFYNFHGNSYAIQKNSQVQVSDNINQSSSLYDNINSINYYTGSQLSPSGYYIYNNTNTGEYSSHNLNSQNITFNTYGINNNFTNYNQTQNEIGIKSTDYSQVGITQFKLTPLSVYLQTHKVYGNNATAGQVLTLKDANTGEVEFEDLAYIIDSLNNSDTSGCCYSVSNGLHKDANQIKLGGNITENTIIAVDTNYMFSIGKYVGGYVTTLDGGVSVGANINNATERLAQLDITTDGTINFGRSVTGVSSKDFLNMKYDDANSKLDFKIFELPTDNSAGQVLAKDVNGFSVWRDVGSLRDTSIVIHTDSIYMQNDSILVWQKDNIKHYVDTICKSPCISGYENDLGIFGNKVATGFPLVRNTTTAMSGFYKTYTGSGKLGVGVTVPTNKLHISDSINPIRIEGLQNGDTLDKILTINGTGIVRSIQRSSLIDADTCYIQAGANVTVGGTGTINNPYIISTSKVAIDSVYMQSDSILVWQKDSVKYYIDTIAQKPRMSDYENDLGIFGNKVATGFPLIRNTNTSMNGFNRTFTGNGDFGIGTINPTSKLHVNDSLNAIIKATSTGGYAGLLMQGNGTIDAYSFLSLDNVNSSRRWLMSHRSLSGQTNKLFFSYYDGIKWYEDVALSKLSNNIVALGLGTTSPSARLHIKDTANLNPLRIEGLVLGDTTNKILTIDNSGVVKMLNKSSIMPLSNTGIQTILQTSTSPIAGQISDKYFYSTATSAKTLTLPTTGVTIGADIYVINHGTVALTLSPGFKNSSSATLVTTLDKAATANTVHLMWNGTNWIKIGN